MGQDERKEETHEDENFRNLRGEKAGDRMGQDNQVAPPLPPDKKDGSSLKGFPQGHEEEELQEEGGLRTLDASQRHEIKVRIKAAYKHGYRQALAVLLGEFMAKAGISPISTIDIIGTVSWEAEDEEPVEKRVGGVLLGYRRAGLDLSPYEGEIRSFFQKGIDELVKLAEEDQIQFSSLQELLSEEFGEKKASGIIAGIQKILGFGIQVELVRVSERERLYYSIVQEILRRHVIRTFYVISPSGEAELGIFRWNGLVYEPWEEGLKAEIERLASARLDLAPKVTRWVRSEARAKIAAVTLTPLREEPLMIAFDNGILNWRKFLEGKSLEESMERPDPNLIVFHRIPHRLRYEVKFDGDLESLAERLCPAALKAFRDWVDEKWPLLLEITGYPFLPRYDLNKAVMFKGDGANGKTTYFRLLTDIFGLHNIVSISLQEICDHENRFVLSDLHHKLLNLYGDLEAKALKDTGRLKIVTGEEYVTADRKHRSRISFLLYAKQYFACNTLPPVSDMTPAFWRRWILIEFPHQFPIDPTFYERTFTKEEIEGLIPVSLYAFREAWRRRKFSFEETSADYKRVWLRETNSVYAFLEDLFAGNIPGYKARRDPEGKVFVSDIYNLYTRYCNEEGREAWSKRAFSEEMERQGFQRVRTGEARFYKGMTLEREKGASLRLWLT